METNQEAALVDADVKNRVLKRYGDCIQYYWRSSKINKRSYKTTRYLTVVLGALVTLISSLASASFVKSSGWLSTTFAISTPLLAALMAIAGGISQTFQWGAAWSDMVITATRVEKERDRIDVTSPAQLDPVKELALLDELVLAETQGIFERLFGSGGPTDAVGPMPAGAGGSRAPGTHPPESVG